jgi:peptidoglycan/xylan/chitin deacetylase (PgdA/CDA1 family)
VVVVVVASLLALALVATPATAAGRDAKSQSTKSKSTASKCRAGKIQLTFDDGPHKTLTPKLLKTLRKHDVVATFFVTGVNAQRHPKILRQMVRDGHSVQVHSWDHPVLTKRPDRSVKRQLRLTRNEIIDATGQRPKFYRPPYGATSKRIRTIAKRYDLREVLWDVDSDDWTGISATTITTRVMGGLRKKRVNNVLMHDAVNNSPQTIKAVPKIAKKARAKKFCFVPMQRQVKPATLSASAQRFVRDAQRPQRVSVVLTLDRPSPFSGTVRVKTRAGSAEPGVDYRTFDRKVRVRRGDRRVTVSLVTLPSDKPQADKRLRLRFSSPKNIRLGQRSVQITIGSDQAWATSVSDVIGAWAA